MQIKRFEAENMTEALRRIKRELGPDALILSARKIKKASGFCKILGKQRVEITAASDNSYENKANNKTHKKKLCALDYSSNEFDLKKQKEGDYVNKALRKDARELRQGVDALPKKNGNAAFLSRSLLQLRHQMMRQGVQEEVLLNLLGEINRHGFFNNATDISGLKPLLVQIIGKLIVSSNPIKIKTGKQKRIAFVGTTGVGKTTTVAKLAAQQILQQKKKVALVSLDHYRIAAIEQSRIYAKILGIPLETASCINELKHCLARLSDSDVILIDTPGRNPRDEEKMNELRSFIDNIPSIETHLVLSATTKEEDIMDTMDRFEKISIDSLIFTKLDESTTYGLIINQLFRTVKPISYFTTGQNIPEDIEVATAEKLVNLILNRENLIKFKFETMHSEFSRNNGKKKITYPDFQEFYVANKNSDVFHNATCKLAKKIMPENLVMLKSKEEAEKNWFKPCKICRP